MIRPGARSGKPRVRFLTRSGCHICEEAGAELDLLLEDFPGVEVERVDIESDDRLHREHLERIPVVEVDGREVCVIFFDAATVRDALSSGRVR